MKVYINIDGGCSCYDVEVTDISTNPWAGGHEVEVKLSALLGLTSEKMLDVIDELISKHQDYKIEAEDIVNALRREVIDLQVKLSYKASEDRQEAAKNELVQSLRRSVDKTYMRNLALEDEIKDLRAKLKDKERGYRFAGFMDKFDQLWTPVAGRHGLFEFRGEIYSAGYLKSHKDYLAIAYHEEVK